MRKELLAATALSTAALLPGAGANALTAYDWSGVYVGASIGAERTSGAGTFTYPQGSSTGIFFTGSTPNINSLEAGVTPWPTSFDLTGYRATGSVTVGRNWQTGALVFGLETDAGPVIGKRTWSWHKDDVPKTRSSDLSASGGVDYLATIRPRIGIAVDRLMLYGTGGLALGHATFATNARLSEDTGKGANWSGQNDSWQPGFVAGAGAEYAVTDKLSLRAQGLYYNLGSISATATGTPFGGPTVADPYTAKVKLTGTVWTVGFNAHF